MARSLAKKQLDTLAEIMNIGAGCAGVALSQIINKKIKISVSSTDIITTDQHIKNVVGEARKLVSAVYLETLGDVGGAMMFMFDKDSVLRLCDFLFFKKGGSTKLIDEAAQSAIKEVSSILTGVFISAIADKLRLSVFHKTPCFVSGSAGTIVKNITNDIHGRAKGLTCISVKFIEPESKFNGSFAFIPTEEAMKMIFSRIERGGLL